jgi:TRAP transporter TAXI family solute receptor
MKRHLAALGAVVVAGMVFAGFASAFEMNLMTGREKGTYYQFGLNLQQLAKTRGIELGVQPSTGSIENLYAVYKRPHTQIGIVQSDVLAFVTRVQSNPMLVQIAQKTKLVFPLYNEEVHILGKKGIADFDALQGKRVAVGEDGSGTYLTARLLLEVTQLKPAQILTVGTDEALAKLKAGAIDAMFYVAGYPVKLFSEGVSAGDELALVPITNPRAAEFYQQIKIPAGTYPWQGAEVTSVAVKAVLVSYDFRNANCDYVGQFAKLLYENLAWLRQNGHPKWHSVDLNFPLKGWEQYDCVRRHLVKSAPAPAPPPSSATAPGGINPVMDAVKQMLNP